jgi:hypothetical protein
MNVDRWRAKSAQMGGCRDITPGPAIDPGASWRVTLRHKVAKPYGLALAASARILSGPVLAWRGVDGDQVEEVLFQSTNVGGFVHFKCVKFIASALVPSAPSSPHTSQSTIRRSRRSGS